MEIETPIQTLVLIYNAISKHFTPPLFEMNEHSITSATVATPIGIIYIFYRDSTLYFSRETDLMYYEIRITDFGEDYLEGQNKYFSEELISCLGIGTDIMPYPANKYNNKDFFEVGQLIADYSSIP